VVIDLDGIAFGINNAGQAVGSTQDSQGNWSHAFIWEDNVMTDLNTLFPASSNLCATMANKINERGQISGMAIVLSGLLRNTNPRGGINGTSHGFFFDTKNFWQTVSRFCSGSDIGCLGRATLRSACTLCKERANCSCTEYYWGGRMRSLQPVTDSRVCGAGAANASFRVTFIVRRFFGQSSTPSTKSVGLSEHSQ
jgi:probable HAF family extracellular repeat protein